MLRQILFLLVAVPCSLPLPSIKGRHKIPSFIKICKRSDPNLNECVKHAVEQIRPYLARGVAELDIPQCEPLELPEIIINQGKGPVSVQSKYTNLKIYGPTEFLLRSVKIMPEKDRARIKLFIPSLYMTGDYSIQGKILMMPIFGKGLSTGNYSDIEANVVIQGERLKRKGKVYFNVVDFFVDFSIGHASVNLSNLFDGDKQLGEAMNLFLNDNWRNVAQEIKPALERTIGDLFKGFSNKIYHKFPLDELLPP